MPSWQYNEEKSRINQKSFFIDPGAVFCLLFFIKRFNFICY